MNLTQRLGLKKPQISDDVQDTIVWLEENFQTIDDSYDEIISNMESFLTTGAVYEAGKKYWNQSVALDGFVGWVNTRTGIFAPSWKAQRTFQAGDKTTAVFDNGHYFECIVGGTSGVNPPAFDTTAGGITHDLGGATPWRASYAYQLNDIVIATNNDRTYYYKCIIAGTTSVAEPAWTNIAGTTIIDGSVHWYVYKTVVWKEVGVSANFIPFGQVDTNTKTNLFQQPYPTNTWVIKHNLGKFPQVTVIDSAGDVVFGDVKYISKDELHITFSMSIQGNAYLN